MIFDITPSVIEALKRSSSWDEESFNDLAEHLQNSIPGAIADTEWGELWGTVDMKTEALFMFRRNFPLCIVTYDGYLLAKDIDLPRILVVTLVPNSKDECVVIDLDCYKTAFPNLPYNEEQLPRSGFCINNLYCETIN
ncbi:hypothetical protein K2X85_20335 [bacterium]|nr:hypothetical protein [bacterium]